MFQNDIPLGRVELERRSVSNVTNNFSSHAAIRENREAIEELRRMLQAIIDHLGVPYDPSAEPPEA